MTQGRLYEPTPEELAAKVAAIKARKASRDQTPADQQITDMLSEARQSPELTPAQELRERKRLAREAKRAAQSQEHSDQPQSDPQEQQPVVSAGSGVDLVWASLMALCFCVLFLIFLFAGVWLGIKIEQSRHQPVTVEIYPDWYYQIQQGKIPE